MTIQRPDALALTIIEIDVKIIDAAAAGPQLPLKDCAEAYRFGRLADETLTLRPDPNDPVLGYSTSCSDGWTTILRRSQDSGDPLFFDRDLEDFVGGFGSPDTEYFMGLSILQL